jgi:hypothetical protein
MYHTIKELKEAIKDLPDEAAVRTEGCDCTGPWDGTVTEDPPADMWEEASYGTKIFTVGRLMEPYEQFRDKGDPTPSGPLP